MRSNELYSTAQLSAMPAETLPSVAKVDQVPRQYPRNRNMNELSFPITLAADCTVEGNSLLDHQGRTNFE